MIKPVNKKGLKINIPGHQSTGN